MGLLLRVDLLGGMEDVGVLWWPGVEGGYGNG